MKKSELFIGKIVWSNYWSNLGKIKSFENSEEIELLGIDGKLHENSSLEDLENVNDSQITLFYISEMLSKNENFVCEETNSHFFSFELLEKNHYAGLSICLCISWKTKNITCEFYLENGKTYFLENATYEKIMKRCKKYSDIFAQEFAQEKIIS